jgi:sirohydrochlorin cobaltochelatase
MGPRPDIEPSAGAGGFFAYGPVRPDGPVALPLIGLAHGSRHAGVVQSIRDLMESVARVGQLPTAGAFLDLVQPDLTVVAQQLAAAGHRAAVVAPHLFTEAFHATVDVPDAVHEATEASGVELFTAEILGTGDDMLEVVEQSMARAGIGGSDSVVLLAVGSSNPDANQAVVDLAARLDARRTGRVVAAFGTRSPRVAEVLDGLEPPTAIVPLFLSPGLLLDPLAELAAERGLTMAAPLGDLVAPLLVRRYQQVIAGPLALSHADL